MLGDYLIGAGFTIVDVSDNYYAYLTSQSVSGKTLADVYSDYFNLIKHESNAEIMARGNVVGTEKVDAATGGEYANADGVADGKVTFTDLPTKTNGGKDAIYAVVETTRPKNTVTTNGAGEIGSNVIGTIPTLIAMPLNGTEPTINIYPKNEVGQLTKDFTNSNDAHVSLAQHISYDIALKLPRDLGERIAATGNLKYKSFTVNEIPGLGLIFGGYNLTTTMVNDGTKSQTLSAFLSEYGLTSNAPTAALVGDGTSKASLTISPASPSGDTTGWAALASKTLTFTVDCWLDEAYFGAHPENIFNDIENKANYKITEDNGFEVVPDEGDVKSVTAKYKFQKNDANTGHPLTGATFSVVAQGVTCNLRFKEIGTVGSGVYRVTASATGVDTLTVGSDGTLTLLGLDSDLFYELTEVTAPAGYRLLTSPIVFQPNDTDDYDSTTDLVVNKNDEDGNHNIYNTPENFLPSTGGRGFAIFSLVAVAGLGGAGVLYALKRKNAQDAA